MSTRTARRAVLVALLALVGLLLVPAPASATAYKLNPASFTATGDVIEGWTWLRATGNSATWTFATSGLAGANTRAVHLNMAALVTNGVNGGSGYSARVKLLVTNGTKKQTLTVSLTNPFRPVDPAFSDGVGYEAYGSSSALSSSLIAAGPTITVTMAYPFSPTGRHVGVKQPALVLGFRK